MLANQQPGLASIKFGQDDSFLRVIKERVDGYFQTTKRRPRDSWQMYCKSAVIVLWFLFSYISLVFLAQQWWQAIPLAASLGLSIAAIGLNIQHDGNHQAYSRHGWINKIMAMSLDMLGGSSYIWSHKHNSIHHTYANITNHDDDINAGFLARLSPHQKRLKVHRLQHVYLWALYSFLPIKWQLIDDFKDIWRGKIGEHRFARPKGRDLAVFIGGKVLSLSLAFVLPAFFHPLLAVLFFYVLACGINGVILSVVFQLAHVVEEAEFPMPDSASGRMKSHWAVHQVQTTVDFARNNPLITWYCGGLNFQIEHHLFPRISHVHYPRISKMVQEVCNEFGIKYNEHKSILAGVVSHWRWLYAMGKPVT